MFHVIIHSIQYQTVPATPATLELSKTFEFSSLSSPSAASALLQHVPDSSGRPKAQPAVSLRVIPDIDPQREIETDVSQPEDDYSGLMADGIGSSGGNEDF